MNTGALAEDPFVSATGAAVLEAGPQRVVVEQPALPELDNHVGVRHASALHAAGYEASRALVAAALRELDADAEMRLARSEIAYTAVGIGPLRTVAEPSGEGWEGLGERLAGGAEAELTCAVTTSNEEGKAVAELSLAWTVVPAAAD